MGDGSPEQIIKTRFDRPNEPDFAHTRLETHGKPTEAVVANANIPGLDRLPPAQRALVLGIYGMNPDQLLNHVNDLAARLAYHAEGAGLGTDVANMIAPATKDVATLTVADKLASNEAIQKLIQT